MYIYSPTFSKQNNLFYEKATHCHLGWRSHTFHLLISFLVTAACTQGGGFFHVFDKSRHRAATFETAVRKLGHKQGFIDLLWKCVILVEHKSRGKDLDKAFQQAKDYFPGLKKHELPKYILVSDFERFRLFDLGTGKTHEFLLRELKKSGQGFLHVREIMRVNVDQFAGTEYVEFQARIAEVAMWLIWPPNEPQSIWRIWATFRAFAPECVYVWGEDYWEKKQI